MSAAILGYGSTFATGDGNSPETFTALAEVSTIGGPKFAVDVIDTSHEGPPRSVREPIAGFLEAGEVSIMFNLVQGNLTFALVMQEIVDRPTMNRRIIFPDGSVFAFQAYLSSFAASEAVDDRITGRATFKITADAVLS